MSTIAPSMQGRARPNRRARAGVAAALLLALLAAMGASTRVVRIGAPGDAPAQARAFEPAAYGAQQFPGIRAAVEARAVEAATLAAAVAKDADAAGRQYGVAGGGAGPEIAVKFDGTVAGVEDGIATIKVAGLPESLVVRVQTGPAVNGTDLRDATGRIGFDQFTNQIDYQNAGYAINDAMKRAVLAGLDTTHLAGKAVSVTGVFQLVNPDGWLVTPVRLELR